MSKASLVALLLLVTFAPCTAQTPLPVRRDGERAAAPTSYARYTKPDQKLVVYAPESWARTGEKLEFLGPDGAILRVVYEEVPEGMSVKAYVAASIKSLRGVIGDNDPPEVRRVRMSGLDAREFTVESLSPERGRLHLRFAVAVHRTSAIVVVLVAPAAQAASIEPIFRTVVESTALVTDPSRIDEVSKSAPAPLAERNAIVQVVDSTSQTARVEAAGRLAEMCRSFPQAVADLLLDARPIVRATAVDAIGACGDPAHDELLFAALGDADPFVSERAARAVAHRPNAVALLRERYDDWHAVSSGELARIVALLPLESRAEIANGILSAPPAPRSSAPAIAPSARAVFALGLLADIPPTVSPIPYTRLVAAKNDAVLTSALLASLGRGEAVPVDVLLPLLGSHTESVFTAAARNLGRSAAEADVARVEAARGGAAKAGKRAGWSADPNAEIDRAIACIRLRAELARTSDGDRRDVIARALATRATADRLWADVASEAIEGHQSTISSDARWLDTVRVAPLGENLYPEHVHVYTAAPDPQVAVERMFAGLTSAQLGSARDQASFALMLAGVREQLAQSAGLAGDELSFERLGLGAHDPASIAFWSAESAPEGATSAARAAALVRVVDRDRFERLVFLAHDGADQPYWTYPIVVGTFARAVSLVPTLGPLAAMDLVVRQKTSEAPRASAAGLRGGHDSRAPRFAREDVCLGVPVKVFRRRAIGGPASGAADELWLAYAGDRAILAAGRESMRDVLTRLRGGGPALGASPDFRAALAGGGDVVYLSGYEGRGADAPAFAEQGALRVSNDGWENTFRVSMPSASGVSVFEPFAPAEAAAPRELLPRSTMVYAVARVDAAFWSTWGRWLFGPKGTGVLDVAWAVDFDREVAPELDRECGAALLELPSQSATGSWTDGLVLFFKLRSDRLAERAARGALVKGSGGMRAVVKKGFLVVASSPAALARLDESERLAADPSYARASAGLPERTVAFGGYNSEAALSRFDRDGMAPETRMIVDVIASMARAFNKHGFWVAPSPEGGLAARLSVGFDHEGGHVVSDLSERTKEFAATFATIDTRGVPVSRQAGLERLKLRIRSTAPGTLDRIRDDIASESTTVGPQTADDLVATILPRRPGQPAAIALPVGDPAFGPFLRPSREVRSDAETVRRTAREIAGTDRDAWSVARKLATWTHENLKWKRVDDADAVDTLATREADCLEFSELYVAMARSLGLPARIVSGVAYSGGAFGGHAWVEVWAGRWIEIDPTWGTEFVDATHVRTVSNSLVAYGALNLVDIEVLEAPRAVPEYGADSARFAAALCEDLSKGSVEVLADALDPEALADDALGASGWASLDDRGRRGVLGFYERLMLEMRHSFGDEEEGLEFRVVNTRETGDRATALVVYSDGVDDVFLRLRMARRGAAWTLVEMENVDLSVNIVGEIMRPAFDAVRARKRGEPERAAEYAPIARALALSSHGASEALAAVEAGLAETPTDRQLRHFKANCLLGLGKREEGLKVLNELVAEPTPHAASLFMLGEALAADEKPGRALRTSLYERYAALAPDDPRPHTRLAWLAEEAKDSARAESEYRAAVALDSRSSDSYLDLAVFQLEQGRAADAVATVDTAPDKKAFDALVVRMYWYDEVASLERLALAFPDRVRNSSQASLYVGRAYLSVDRPNDAMPLIRRAIELQPDDADTRLALVEAFRVQKDWRQALATADEVLKSDAEVAGAHYERACALARLGRADEAMVALKRSVELDDDYAFGIAEDEDLSSLAGRADFKALIPTAEQDE